MNLQKITKEFNKLLKNNEKFQEALEIVERNALGKIWLIGGSVYKNIAHIIYNTPPANADFDFIVEKRKEKINLPLQWKLETNSFGNFKFVSKFNVDFIPLAEVRWMKERNFKPILKNFLLHTPFTIQSMAYDIKRKKILGNIGLNAIVNKIVRVLDPIEANFYSQRTGLSIETLMKNKLKDLGFKIT